MQHKHTAQGLASLGRGPDTELVHMTKGEVHGLQKLAMAHGGTLTINPETGLAEAGFLSSLLPMVLGAGAMMIPGVGPLMAAGLVGGGYGVATGSLKKGLMAGLGAYGGASLAGGLAEAGASSLGAAGAGATPAATAGLGATATSGTAGLDAALSNTAGQATQAFGGNTGMFSAVPETVMPTFGGSTLAPTTSAFGPSTVTQMPTIQAAAPQFVAAAPAPVTFDNLGAGLKDITSSGAKAMNFATQNKGALLSAGAGILGGMEPSKLNAPEQNPGMIRPYTFSRTQNEQPDAIGSLYNPGQSTRERQYFNDQYTAGTPYKAPGPEYMAGGGPVEAMSNANAIGANTGYPMADIHTGAYATPFQQPMSQNVVQGAQDSAVDPYTGQATFADGGTVQPQGQSQYANGSVGGYNYDQATGAYSRSPEMQGAQTQSAPQGFFGSQLLDAFRQLQEGQRPQYANGSVGGYNYDQGTGQFSQQPAMAGGGGISTLGGYSDGGQLLRGPGDGVSDNIPAMIGNKQQARLADGEFVIPARIVSELGNGSTEAGSRQLYAMLDRVQNARKKSIGKDKVATNSRAAKLLPA